MKALIDRLIQRVLYATHEGARAYYLTRADVERYLDRHGK